MVLFLDPLEGILRNHVVILTCVKRICEESSVFSPVSDGTICIANQNLEQVRELQRAGYTEIKIADKT